MIAFASIGFTNDCSNAAGDAFVLHSLQFAFLPILNNYKGCSPEAMVQGPEVFVFILTVTMELMLAN